MITTEVSIIEDGSVNGRVCHSIIGFPGPMRAYSLKTSSAGIGHHKHDTSVTERNTYGVAGQDVYGHDSDSIFVADGHGSRGLEASLATIEMRKVLSDIETKQIIQDVYAVEHSIRSSIVDLLEQADFEHSGSTFVNMRVFEKDGRRFVITINVGDSEALLVYHNRVHVCSVAHSWDDLNVFNRYIKNCERPKNVCYNRWNASRHRLIDPDGEYRPMMMYDIHENRAVVNTRNLDWVTSLHKRVNKPSIMHGTQGVRIPANSNENWGSSVMLYGTARGQNMATFGDNVSRHHTKVPLEMVHVYVHEIPSNETVVGVVQSDGISNRLPIINCGYLARSSKSASAYISKITGARDDLSIAMFVSEPVAER